MPMRIVLEKKSMVLIRGNSIISKPKNLSENSMKKAYIRRFLTAYRMMRNFTQASQNVTTGQKNGPKLKTYQNNRYYVQRLSRTTRSTRRVLSFSIPSKFSESGPMKSRPDYHETTRVIVSMNKEAG